MSTSRLTYVHSSVARKRFTSSSNAAASSGLYSNHVRKWNSSAEVEAVVQPAGDPG